ncbi:unnamed protein product [Paramecium octaurelia]|uniref:Uncharacterized protein n=1 Tax=Paramecium octaurelia TaxID=43137 RepID=A0A8S1WXP8_PAROT|nr:unnamed protein product [Paramecium octaurelia]
MILTQIDLIKEGLIEAETIPYLIGGKTGNVPTFKEYQNRCLSFKIDLELFQLDQIRQREHIVLKIQEELQRNLKEYMIFALYIVLAIE